MRRLPYLLQNCHMLLQVPLHHNQEKKQYWKNALNKCLLGLLLAHELPPKWAGNEEVLHWLKGEVKLPPLQNLRSPLKLMTSPPAFQTLLMPYLSGNIYENWVKNHCWGLPCHYFHMVTNNKSVPSMYIPGNPAI